MTPTEKANLEIIQNLEQNVQIITTEHEFQVQLLSATIREISENMDKVEVEMLTYNEKLRLDLERTISDEIHFLHLLHGRYETLLRKCKRTRRKWKQTLLQQVNKRKFFKNII